MPGNGWMIGSLKSRRASTRQILLPVAELPGLFRHGVAGLEQGVVEKEPLARVRAVGPSDVLTPWMGRAETPNAPPRN